MTCGTVMGCICIDDVEIWHTFHVVPNDFAIPTDGLIGNDFLHKYFCKLDYFDFSLTIRTESKDIVISFNHELNNHLIIPPRCEIFRVFKLSNNISTQFPYIIPSGEIASGVFLANTIAYDDNPVLRVMNTNSTMNKISNRISIVRNISDFNIYTHKMDRADDKDDRTQRVIDILKPNIPEQFKFELIELCTEFADIFALDTDKMSTNNIYTQKLRTVDAEPVYQRNYRLPKCHKDEIDRQVSNLLKNDLIEPS